MKRHLYVPVVLLLVISFIATTIGHGAPAVVSSNSIPLSNPTKMALDSTSHTIYVISHYDASLTVIDATSMTVKKTIVLDNYPEDIAVDTANYVYITYTLHSYVDIYNTQTWGKTRIDFGNRMPFNLRSSPHGGIVAAYATPTDCGWINLDSQTIPDYHTIPCVKGIGGQVMLPYVVESDHHVFVVYNTYLTRVFPYPAGSSPSKQAEIPDFGDLVVNHALGLMYGFIGSYVYMYDERTLNELTSTGVAAASTNLAVNESSGHVYTYISDGVGLRIWDAGLQPLAQDQTDSYATQIAVDSSTGIVYLLDTFTYNNTQVFSHIDSTGSPQPQQCHGGFTTDLLTANVQIPKTFPAYVDIRSNLVDEVTIYFPLNEIGINGSICSDATITLHKAEKKTDLLFTITSADGTRSIEFTSGGEVTNKNQFHQGSWQGVSHRPSTALPGGYDFYVTYENTVLEFNVANITLDQKYGLSFRFNHPDHLRTFAGTTAIAALIAAVFEFFRDNPDIAKAIVVEILTVLLAVETTVQSMPVPSLQPHHTTASVSDSSMALLKAVFGDAFIADATITPMSVALRSGNTVAYEGHGLSPHDNVLLVLTNNRQMYTEQHVTDETGSLVGTYTLSQPISPGTWVVAVIDIDGLQQQLQALKTNPDPNALHPQMVAGSFVIPVKIDVPIVRR